MRDYRALLADETCWDPAVQAGFEACGEPQQDCILQNREELIDLCEFIERQRIRSYLEIGVWTGRLVSALDRLFDLEPLAACDEGWAETLGLAIRLPPKTRFFRGRSESEAFRAWRAGLGHVDLVLIDADHAYPAVRRDFELNRAYPHRFLALHDITGNTRQTTGVRKLWREIGDGHKLEIIRPQRELGLEHSLMGIGIWSATEVP